MRSHREATFELPNTWTEVAQCRLGVQILSNYISLDGEVQARNIAAWTPVVAEVLQGFSGFEDSAVSLFQIC